MKTLNLHEFIKGALPDTESRITAGDMRYNRKTEAYNLDTGKTQERVLIHPRGSIVIIEDSGIGRMIKGLLLGYGLKGTLDQGKYINYSKRDLINAGLI